MSLEKNDSVELKRLINLVHVPEVNREFNELHDRLKDKDIQQHVVDFKTRKRELFIELYKDRWEGDGGANTAGYFYWFELTCYGPGDWRLTLAYPLHDVSIVPQYEILPNQVIEKIIDTPVNPHEVRSVYNLKSEFWRKVGNVKFCRLSEGFICGTVELCKRLKGNIERNKKVNIASRDFEMAFRKFYYLFLHQPGLIYSFMVDFLKAKIPGLKIMAGNGQEVNRTEPPLKIPDINLLMQKNSIQMLEKNTGPEDVNLFKLIDAPKANILGRILQLQVRLSADYEYKKQVDDYEARLKQIRQDLTGIALDQLGRSGQDPCSYPPLYWFELSPFSKSSWGMTRMRPMPTFVPYAYILPDAIVEWISRNMPLSGYPVGFYSIGDGKLLRPVKYWVVRLSSNHIVGIAVMDIDKIREMYRFEDNPVVTGLYSAYWILDRYLHQNPDDIKELAFRFQEAYSRGIFGPFVFPTRDISPLSLIKSFM
jgi:hypothetical protein